MKAIISVYKSEILEYMKTNDLKNEDVIMICSNAEFEKAKGAVDDVVLLSAPMGVPMNLDYIRFALIKSETEVKPIAEQVLDEPGPELKDFPDQDQGDKEETPPVIGGDAPSNEEEVAEVEPAPKPTAKAAPKKKATPKKKVQRFGEEGVTLAQQKEGKSPIPKK